MTIKPVKITKYSRGDQPAPAPRYTRGDAPVLQPVLKPEPEPVSEPMPSWSQERSNGHIRIRRQSDRPKPDHEPEWHIRRPTKAELMGGTALVRGRRLPGGQ